MRFKQSLFLASAVCFPLLIGATSPHLIGQLRTAVTIAADPFLESQSRAFDFLKTSLVVLSQIPVLHQKTKRLEHDLQLVQGELISLSELKQENERLSALLDLKKKSASSSVAARVIGRDPSHWSHFVVINKGQREGARVDSVLVHPKGLVGKVIAAGPGKIADDGTRVPMGVKKGQVVLFTKYGPNEIKLDGKEYLIAKEDDILAREII